jgi:hypothetical protein
MLPFILSKFAVDGEASVKPDTSSENGMRRTFKSTPKFNGPESDNVSFSSGSVVEVFEDLCYVQCADKTVVLPLNLLDFRPMQDDKVSSVFYSTQSIG